jgi:phosphatidylglycerophosphate synthase
MPDAPRRPLAARQRPWAQALARWLTRTGISPNSISYASIAFAILAGLCFLGSARTDGAGRSLLFLGAAASMQLRLLCNMLDGMVAIEGGKKSVYGEILNDMPDRFSDAIILVTAGYSITNFAYGPELGGFAAMLAVLTAYVRLLGGSIGTPQYFFGPMAKPHRMAVLTVACIVSSLEPLFGRHLPAIAAALGVIIVGCIATIALRTARIASDCRAGR